MAKRGQAASCSPPYRREKAFGMDGAPDSGHGDGGTNIAHHGIVAPATRDRNRRSGNVSFDFEDKARVVFETAAENGGKAGASKIDAPALELAQSQGEKIERGPKFRRIPHKRLKARWSLRQGALYGEIVVDALARLRTQALLAAVLRLFEKTAGDFLGAAAPGQRYGSGDQLALDIGK